MAAKAREKFQKLTQDYIEAMTRVDAPLTDYVDALDEAISELEMMKEAGEADLAREQDEEN